MPFVYIGRTHTFYGNSLWEIVGRLKDYGVGRMVIRNRQRRYSEPSFMRILVAEPAMDKDNFKGKIIVDSVFRGQRMGEMDLSRIAYKTDYSLVPKHEEHIYLKALEEFKPKMLRIYAPTAEMPPLLKLIAQRKGHHATVFPVKLKEENSIRARVAKEGETYNSVVKTDLGTPVCNRLYEDVNFDPPTL